MGSKGKQTSTTNSVSQYLPAAQTKEAGSQALTQAQQAAAGPYTLGAQPIAGFNPDQTAGFEGIRQGVGMAQPYYDAATGMALQAASPITGGTIEQYLNPYANFLTQGLEDTFARQRRDVTGGLTAAAGGVGADRIAIGQGNLAKQQTLGMGQALAGIYQPALQAAENERQRQQASAYSLGQFGQGSQNSWLQGLQALLSGGGQQQQLQQAQLNAPYAQQQAQFAYPFQTSQFLMGLAGASPSALGYTGTQNSTTQSQYQPSGLGVAGQVLGGLTSLAGLGMGIGGGGGLFGGMGKGGGGMYGPTYPGAVGGYGMMGGTPYPVFRKGGGVKKSKSADFSKALMDIYKAAGGAVNPFDVGESFQRGGDIDESWDNTDEQAPRMPQMVMKPYSKTGERSVFDTFLPAEREALASPPEPSRDMGDSPVERSGGLRFPDPGPTNPFGELERTPLPRGNPRTTGGVRASMANEVSEAGGSTNALSGIYRATHDESQFNPNLRHPDQPRWSGEAHYAHGLFQEGGQEWLNYQRWLADREGPEGKEDWRDPALQTKFLAENLQKNYPRVWEAMNNAQSPGEAADIFTRGYLKPSAENLSARSRQYRGDPGEREYPNVAVGNPYAIANRDMRVGDYTRSPNRPYPDATPRPEQRDWGQRLVRSPWLSLVNAGATMMDRGEVGKGILAGTKTLEQQRHDLGTEEGINERSDSLYQRAKAHLDEYQRMTPAQKAMSEYREASLESRKKLAAYNVKFEDGTKGVASYDPKTGQYYGTDGAPVKVASILGKQNPQTETTTANQAMTLAKADVAGFASDPLGTLNKVRKKLGLKPYDSGEAQPMPKSKEELQNGTIYTLPGGKGKAIWDGENFIPLGEGT